MVNVDEVSTWYESVGGVAVVDRRGNNSIKVTKPIAARTSPAIVKISACLLGLAAMGWDCGGGTMGTPIRCFFFLLRFDLLDIEGLSAGL